MRATKIIATLGPASDEPDVLCDLIRAGVDVFRCNFSHGSIETHKAACDAVREAGRRVGREVALLQDLCGPKIRVEQMRDGAIELVDGQNVTITTAEVLGTPCLFGCSYKSLPQDVSRGDRILLDDGLLELEVLSAAGEEVTCRVKHGGVLHDHKGMNLPGVALSTPSVTPTDFRNLAAGEEMDFDYIALSFVRAPEDIAKVRRITEKFAHPPLIIAKIEKPEAIERIDAIIEEADGIMVARGDLAVEMAAERVPILQQDLIRRANAVDKIVIVATQMLESMKENFSPTRAEVSDVAIAVFEGADALMLSAETSVGRYPIEAVKTMGRIAETMEEKLAAGHPHWDWRRHRVTHPLGDAISNAAFSIYQTLGTKAIVAYSNSGRTGLYLSKCRPFTYLAIFTRSRSVARRMRLFWGIEPVYCPHITTAPDLRYYAFEHLREHGVCAGTDNIVMISGSPFGMAEHSNALEILQLSGNFPAPCGCGCAEDKKLNGECVRPRSKSGESGRILKTGESGRFPKSSESGRFRRHV